MAAAELTEVKRNEMHLVPIIVRAMCTTAGGDWVVLNGHKGVVPIGQGICMNVASSLTDSITYGVMTINNGGAAYSATDTSFVMQTATITRVMPYYIMSGGGEIMEVLTDSDVTSATPTITVRRGCLGTTPSATGLANTNVLAILNILFMGGARIGPHIFVALPLPNDPRYVVGDGGVR